MKKFFVFLLTFLFFPVFISGQNIDSGLIGYWKFDEGFGNLLKDEYGNKEGVLYPPYLRVKDFELHDVGSIYVREGGRAEIIEGGDLSGLQKFTISIWANWNDSNQDSANESSGIYGPLLSRQKDGYFTDGVIGLTASNPGGAKLAWSGRGVKPSIISNVSIGLNTWRHIVITSDGESDFLYIDGDLQGQSIKNYNRFYQDSDVPLVLGGWKGGGEGQMSGFFDELRIYSRYLNKEDIEALFNRGRNVQSEILDYCGKDGIVDSDNGIQIYVAGKLNYINCTEPNLDEYNFTDVCVFFNGTSNSNESCFGQNCKLREYFISSDKLPRSRYYFCQNGCLGGICLKEIIPEILDGKVPSEIFENLTNLDIEESDCSNRECNRKRFSIHDIIEFISNIFN